MTPLEYAYLVGCNSDNPNLDDLVKQLTDTHCLDADESSDLYYLLNETKGNGCNMQQLINGN